MRGARRSTRAREPKPMEIPATWSNLGRVGKRPADDSTRARLRALLLWAPPAALLLLASLGAILADEAALRPRSMLVVASRLAGLLGRRAGRAAARGAAAGDRRPLRRAAQGAGRAGDRPGGDRAEAVDGGRVPGRGHGRAHRADRALLDAAGRAGRDGGASCASGSATRRRCTTSARWRSPTRSC